MRSDLTKVLTERERSGSRTRTYRQVRSRGNRIDLSEDGVNAVRQGMKRPHLNNTKDFTDVLSPLKGILRKAVGRKWDDFYSELVGKLDRRTVQGQHVFEHLYNYIVVNDHKGNNCWKGDGIFVKDGKLWVRQDSSYEGRSVLLKIRPLTCTSIRAMGSSRSVR